MGIMPMVKTRGSGGTRAASCLNAKGAPAAGRVWNLGCAANIFAFLQQPSRN